MFPLRTDTILLDGVSGKKEFGVLGMLSSSNPKKDLGSRSKLVLEKSMMSPATAGVAARNRTVIPNDSAILLKIILMAFSVHFALQKNA
jgi:hypothetical protein